MPPSTWTAARAFSIGRLAGEQLGRADRALDVAHARGRRGRPPPRRWRCGPARCGRTCPPSCASAPGTWRSAGRTARARGRSRGPPAARCRRRRAAAPRSAPWPRARSRAARSAVADLRPRGELGEPPDRGQRVERLERLGGGQLGSLDARRRRRRRRTSRTSRSAACSTRIGSSIGRGGVVATDDRRRRRRPRTGEHGGAEGRPQDRPLDQVQAELLEHQRPPRPARGRDRRRPRGPAGANTPRSASSVHRSIGQRRALARADRVERIAGGAEAVDGVSQGHLIVVESKVHGCAGPRVRQKCLKVIS